MAGIGDRDGGYAGVPQPLDCRIVRQRRLTSSFRTASPSKKVADFLLHQGFGPQAQVSGGLLSRPAPDRLIGVEVRAVARQVQ